MTHSHPKAIEGCQRATRPLRSQCMKTLYTDRNGKTFTVSSRRRPFRMFTGKDGDAFFPFYAVTVLFPVPPGKDPHILYIDSIRKDGRTIRFFQVRLLGTNWVPIQDALDNGTPYRSLINGILYNHLLADTFEEAIQIHP